MDCLGRLVALGISRLWRAERCRETHSGRSLHPRPGDLRGSWPEVGSTSGGSSRTKASATAQAERSGTCQTMGSGQAQSVDNHEPHLTAEEQYETIASPSVRCEGKGSVPRSTRWYLAS